MKTTLLKHKWTLAGVLIGGAGGYAYYHFVGCASGTCLITSRPLPSILYGAVVGALLLTGLSDFFRKS